MVTTNEYRALWRLVDAQGQGWRLRRREKDQAIYTLTDASTNAILADDLSAEEVRRLCAGVIGLGQLRQ